ncbi:hypothetical protein K1T71_011635 [Dendrolimus kikuchii]|uniref:Uncharacterized protein n=1 Tax=Dendrolimus kikuchii TaxID=765133 RepID=A0ACC1CLR6_9NEOP|nr:hypothetical protein K1T71_011635 [Dendrolimus kikuchii]
MAPSFEKQLLTDIRNIQFISFPSNPFTCGEWISIVARERRDEFYKPAKNSVIFSDHFDKSDISGNTNRRRLVKTAVPKLQPLSSSSDVLLDMTQKATYIQDPADQISVMTSPVASLSDLVSVCGTPRKRFLNKQLLTARKVIDNK